MKNFAKLLALVLACLMMVAVFAACGGDSSDTEGSGEINAPVETGNGLDNEVKDDVPADLRFDGETVTFFIRNDQEIWLYEMDVDEIMNDTLYDAIYYRNKTVEERLGVTVTTIGQAGTYSKRAEWNDTLRTAVNTKLNDFDSAAIYMSTGSVLAVEGIYYNVIDFPYISLEKPWWNQNIQNELTLFNTLYYLAGDIAITETAGGNALFYNKDLFDKYYSAQGVDLYAEVDGKTWTIDCLYELVAGVHEDVNADGIVSDGDVVGYSDSAPENVGDGSRDAWVAAMGIDITTMVNGVPELSFYSARTVDAFDKVQTLVMQNPGTLAVNDPVSTKFENGNALFVRGELNKGSQLREMKDRYGVLPLPMLEADQEGGYRTVCTNNSSLITILSSLPTTRKEVVGATIELMAAESYKQVTPAYYEIALKSKYSEDPADARMYDIILDSFTFSFGYCYSTETLGGVGGLFRNLTIDFAEKWDEKDDLYEEQLTKLINGLDEAAFNAMYGG